MSKIPAASAAKLFEEIIGWPYASPGTNDQRGIDCSGAWVRVYKAFGESVYHGSNTIYRKHCAATGAIASALDLSVGMAVFKNRRDGKEPAQYHGDGIGNMYHIGCVTGVSPLRIVHATTPVAKLDTAASAWTHWGRMDRVVYDGAPEDPGGSTPTPEFQAKVTTQSSPLNLRKEASTSAALLGELPRGAVVQVLTDPGEWLYVEYKGLRGYASARYLKKV